MLRSVSQWRPSPVCGRGVDGRQKYGRRVGWREQPCVLEAVAPLLTVEKASAGRGSLSVANRSRFQDASGCYIKAAPI